MADKQKRGKWLDVSFEVGEFDGDTSGKIELSIVTGKCEDCLFEGMTEYCPKESEGEDGKA